MQVFSFFGNSDHFISFFFAQFHFSNLNPYRAKNLKFAINTPKYFPSISIFPPTEHWNISESEEEHQEQKDNESEFTTDSEMSDADDK